MPLKILRNDITRMQVDAIVNTANAEPIYSSGVDTAVYRAAGVEELLTERRRIGSLQEGEAAITPGFRLPAKYIIHAVSPYYRDENAGAEEKLRACYRNSLQLALENNCQSIAFPLIATGSFGYPKEEGMRIAVDEINAFLLGTEMLIYMVVFDETTTELGRHLHPALESYIDSHYVEEKLQEEYHGGFRCAVRSSKTAPKPKDRPVAKFATLAEESYCDFLEDNASALQERMSHLSDTFQEYLMYLIEIKQLSNAEVYKRAIISKQLFSKIKLNPAYHPDKATAMRLCVGAKLNLDETRDLLARAGYALSPCDKRDIIFSFFIEHKVFDMIEIDIALEEHGLPCFIE